MAYGVDRYPNPPDIAWDEESWDEHERAREAKEERDWKEGFDGKDIAVTGQHGD